MFPPWMDKDPHYAKFKVGRWTYGRPRIDDYGLPAAAVSIGSFCAIAGEVHFVRAQHRMDWVTTAGVAEFLLPPKERAGKQSIDPRGDIVVGSDVWIGWRALIMPNVKIGDGATIGACAVVTRDVPPYAVTAGVPAIVRRYRFPPWIIEALLRIRWWNWPDETIRERIAEIMSPNIESFVKKYDLEAKDVA